MGHFNVWDPKITTFPGLYYVSAGLHALQQCIVYGRCSFHTALGLCSSSFLRTVNVAMGFACVFVIHGIVSHHSKETHSGLLYSRTMACALFPFFMFYIFLYYTDTASTLFVLSTWLALLKKQYTLSGILSACSILMRQTNAVWTVCLVGWDVMALAQRASGGQHHQDGGTFFSECTLLLRYIFGNIIGLMRRFWLHLLSVAAFLGFVISNGGIVLGDKDHHIPVNHWMQPFYFYTFLVSSTSPLWIHEIPSIFSSCTKRGLLGIVLLFALSSMAVCYGTLVHPFILADNRHYIFYIWRRIINATPYSRYLLVPLYATSSWVALCSFQRHPVNNVVITLCTAMTLIPAHLIEPRYFTTPWFLYVLGPGSVLYRSNQRQVVCLCIGYFVTNAVMMVIFLFKGFSGPDGSVSRFMP